MIILDMPETLEADSIDLEQMGIETTNGHSSEPTGATDEAPVSCVESVAIADVTGNGEVVDAEFQVIDDDDDHDETDPEEREAEERLCNCQLRIATLKRQLKFAKAELDEATETLEGIRRRGEKKNDDAETAETKEIIADVAGSLTPVCGTSEMTIRVLPESGEPADWRTVPLPALGLKEATAKRLLEHDITTLGQLEDLRAKGNVKGVGLRSIKGIGDAKVTEIEDAVVAWFTKHPMPDTEAKAETGATSAPATEAAAETGAETAILDSPPTEASTIATASPPVEPPGLTSTTTPAGIAKHDSDAVSAAQISARAKEINDGSPNCLDKKLKKDEKGRPLNYWEAGQEHCKQGDPMTECGIIPGPEQDDWLRGFMAEQMLEEFEPTEA